MANATRTVRVRFDGTATGLNRAAKQAERDLERVRAKASSLRDGAIKFGAITGLVGAIGSLGGPAVAGGVAAVGALAGVAGTAMLAFSGTGDAVEAFNKALESGDYSEYEKELAKLPKSQQAMVRELVKTQQEFKKLKTTAADNALPGITNAIKASRDLLPTLDAAVKRSGKVISDTGDDFADLFRSKDFQRNLDGWSRAVEPVERSIGRFLVNTTGQLAKFGSEQKEAAAGFASFLDSTSDGLGGLFDELAPYSADFKLVWESLGDVIEEVLPIAGRFFGEAARTWGPILRDVADWLGDNSDELKEWAGILADATPYLLGAAIGLKALKAAAAGLDLARAIGGAFGAAERDAPGKGRRAGSAWRGGFIAAAGVLIGAEILGQLTPGEWNEKGASLGQQFGNGVADNASKLLSGDFAGIVANYRTFWGQVVDEGTNAILGLIRNTSGQTAEFNLSANPTQANGVISYTIQTANGAQGTVTLGANGAPAMVELNGVKYTVDATTGTLQLAANQDPALGTLNGTRVTIDRTTGRLTIAGNNGAAIRDLSNTTGAINRSSGTVRILADAAAAYAKVSAFIRSIPTFVSVAVRAVTGGAGGGPVGAVAGVPGYKRGGPIFGPGTGTSDSIPALAGRNPIRVANNEHIVTEREVMSVGGHGAVYRIRRAMLDGSLRRFLDGPGYAGGGAVGAARQILARLRSRQQMFEDWSWRGNSAEVSQWNDFLQSTARRSGLDPVAFLEKYIRDAERQQAQTQARSAARSSLPTGLTDTDRIIAAVNGLRSGTGAALPPNVQVTVMIDGQEFRGMMRTEIAADNANTRRLVGSGSGRGW